MQSEVVFFLLGLMQFIAYYLCYLSMNYALDKIRHRKLFVTVLCQGEMITKLLLMVVVVVCGWGGGGICDYGCFSHSDYLKSGKVIKFCMIINSIDITANTSFDDFTHF